MKHLSIKSTVYPKDRIETIKPVPMYIIQKFWTNFNMDAYTAVVNAKRLISIIVLIVGLSSCSTHKPSSVSLMKVYPDYYNNIINAEIIESNDTLYYYDLSPDDFRDLLMARERTAFIISYKEGE